jgi:hypothetical protein
VLILARLKKGVKAIKVCCVPRSHLKDRVLWTVTPDRHALFLSFSAHRRRSKPRAFHARRRRRRRRRVFCIRCACALSIGAAPLLMRITSPAEVPR